mmetsp:Transcript_55107/g.118259  ORF Transcript_55107/g.118259 Transcript_55107/m.118259 type:complete len:135 (-) Transcript_55107:43-447(-)
MGADKEEVPNAAPCAAVLVAQGIFLAGCGCYGAHSHGWTGKVMHSAYAGLGGMASLSICAAMSVSGSRKLYMIGVHVALMLQALFVGVFSLQSYKSYGVPEKADRLPLFVVMGLGSMAGLGGMILLKPKKKKSN